MDRRTPISRAWLPRAAKRARRCLPIAALRSGSQLSGGHPWIKRKSKVGSTEGRKRYSPQMAMWPITAPP